MARYFNSSQFIVKGSRVQEFKSSREQKFKSSRVQGSKSSRFILLALTLTLALSFSSCQEGRDAGDLLGQWRMADSDTKYISFSGSIALFRYVEDGELRHNVFGNFQHVGDSLFIQCYSIKEDQKAGDTQLIENTFEMKPSSNIRVKIETLDNKHLSLSKDGKWWHFYKY